MICPDMHNKWSQHQWTICLQISEKNITMWNCYLSFLKSLTCGKTSASAWNWFQHRNTFVTSQNDNSKLSLLQLRVFYLGGMSLIKMCYGNKRKQWCPLALVHLWTWCCPMAPVHLLTWYRPLCTCTSIYMLLPLCPCAPINMMPPLCPCPSINTKPPLRPSPSITWCRPYAPVHLLTCRLLTPVPLLHVLTRSRTYTPVHPLTWSHLLAPV